jgi:uncharacterized membrane protein YgdD (TMEM256/DUF423 family)
MTPNLSQVRIAAVFGALAVILGALGAHGGLHTVLEAHGRTATWETASHYHLVHAVVLLVLGLTGISRWGWNAIAAGIVIFSGSLYLLSVTGITRLAALTPFGGVALIAGWLLLAFKR